MTKGFLKDCTVYNNRATALHIADFPRGWNILYIWEIVNAVEKESNGNLIAIGESVIIIIIGEFFEQNVTAEIKIIPPSKKTKITL